jgi:hypothetical protein
MWACGHPTLFSGPLKVWHLWHSWSGDDDVEDVWEINSGEVVGR